MIHFHSVPSIAFLIIILAAMLAIIILASAKLIKSKLPDWEKVYWTVAMVILNVIAAIPFIIFHDYFLSRDKRANYNSVV